MKPAYPRQGYDETPYDYEERLEDYERAYDQYESDID